MSLQPDTWRLISLLGTCWLSSSASGSKPTRSQYAVCPTAAVAGSRPPRPLAHSAAGPRP
eukprot:1182751-Prorocentrum_minimum.AAC.1